MYDPADNISEIYSLNLDGGPAPPTARPAALQHTWKPIGGGAAGNATGTSPLAAFPDAQLAEACFEVAEDVANDGLTAAERLRRSRRSPSWRPL